MVDLGVSGISARGKVYNLNELAIYGNYVAAQATFAVAGGTGELSMINEKGTVIILTAEQSGRSSRQVRQGITLKLR